MCNLPLSILYIFVTDRSNILTYDKIYNDTKYPQIQYRPRQYYQNNREQKHGSQNNRSQVQSNKTKVIEDDSNLNAIEYSYESTIQDDNTKNDHNLLVGFSHDPYRSSVPENEFNNGER